MKNNILYIIGAVVLVGGGAFLFLKIKKNKDKKKLADLESDSIATTNNSNNTPQTNSSNTTSSSSPTSTPVQQLEKSINADDLLLVARLKDEIISDISKRNRFKKARSRANVQAEIDLKLETLKNLGFGMDTNNQLIKIR